MELPNLINRIEQLRQELTALQPLAYEQQEKLDKKFRLEFNYNSNHIEGNTLTYGETVLYLIFDKTTGEHEGREYEEMKASDVALRLVQELAADKERPLTEAFIKNLNKTILVQPYWVNAITPDGQPTRRQISISDYKKHPNSVRLQNGEMFHYATPQETPASMSDLVQWYREETESKELHPVAIAALLHYKFVRIHPFDDGNGRISRLLMNYVLYYHGLPPVIIKSANKKDYLLALNKADSGDINAFVEYVAMQMLWSIDISVKAAKGESIEEGDDIDKEVALWKKELNNKNPIDAIPKSAVVIEKLFFQSLSPFLNSFRLKIYKSFYDLFNDWEKVEILNGVGVTGNDLSLDLIMTGHFDTLESKTFDILSVYSIGLDIFLNSFKKNVKNHFGVNTKLEILLNRNNYVVSITTPYARKSYPEGGRLYNNPLTPEEHQVIINDTIKSIFNYIKENTEPLS
jgi:Fic family protein